MTCAVKIENAESRNKIYSKWVEIVSEAWRSIFNGDVKVLRHMVRARKTQSVKRVRKECQREYT